ncbi:putative serine/threonine-protein kinase [Acanthamoeba castellanii mimivirus]|uniref:Putative serine/threonine-protein kinase L670 n=5 Tax=Mimivirus TaxID=315393 RepID=YL670_MIMIV|nr:putative serine/threonine-protein kinase [Acanthamoeba polyphaga mimivirus]Q5UNT4.1 RecName: Full=Putative serine/threonine-protein kinase L670 [Acanthamoeba polyphaga mimivirus]AHA45169.1 putative serine/threonine protein kinase [Hirudovirus strain Sangsue]AHJ40292.2 serine threonine-protein kinase [Samba virus]ALR84260.1 putative serine/threonine-protein kinase [Niemeyer virus]AMZ03113.1 putative serine/threonine-protein kinase [Mimivirus Bombay]BAV61794.1 putative serine/threonine-prote
MSLFNNHPELDFTMREMLIDWLINIYFDQNVEISNRSLVSGIMMIDRYIYLEKTSISRKMYQGIGVICLNLACKLDDTKILGLDYCEYICAGIYTADILSNLEKRILKVFKFGLHFKNILHYIKLISIKENVDDTVYVFARLMLITILFKTNYLTIKTKSMAKNLMNFSKWFVNNKNVEIKNPIHIYFFTELRRYITHPHFTSINRLAKEFRIFSLIKSRIPNIIYLEKPNVFSKEIIPIELQNSLTIEYTENQLNNMNVIEKLGIGSFGLVNKVKFDNTEIALKTHHPDDSKEIIVESLREINNMIMLDHPNIIKMHGYYYSQGITHIGLELCDMPLYKKLDKGNLSPELKKSFIIQLLCGLKYLHNNNIIHRDLTSSNVLIKGDTLKICDFGCSRFVYDKKIIGNYSLDVCSVRYRAIEILNGILPYNEKIDIWSCACLIAEILGEKFLFRGRNEIEVLDSINRLLGKTVGSGRVGFSMLEKHYPNETQIIYKMLDFDPSNRPNAKLVLKIFSECFVAQSELLVNNQKTTIDKNQIS